MLDENRSGCRLHGFSWRNALWKHDVHSGNDDTIDVRQGGFKLLGEGIDVAGALFQWRRNNALFSKRIA